MVEALAAENVSSDILAQALANSGLESVGEEDTQVLKERLYSALRSQATPALGETSDETEHGTRVILSDSASGLKRSLHTVRKVHTIRITVYWLTDHWEIPIICISL